MNESDNAADPTDPVFTHEPHERGGYLRSPLGRSDIVGRVAGETIPRGASFGVGEDGQIYVWREERP